MIDADSFVLTVSTGQYALRERQGLHYQPESQSHNQEVRQQNIYKFQKE
jgi:hypothetical protein